jgi:hypothetical protein
MSGNNYKTVFLYSFAGLGLLPASIIAGLVWDLFGQSVSFIFGGALTFITSAGVFILSSRKGIIFSRVLGQKE